VSNKHLTKLLELYVHHSSQDFQDVSLVHYKHLETKTSWIVTKKAGKQYCLGPKPQRSLRWLTASYKDS